MVPSNNIEWELNYVEMGKIRYIISKPMLIEYIIWMVISFVVLGFSAIIHECAHGWIAYKMGDNTAYYEGRITLNPIKHIDPFMTIILPILFLVMSGGRFVLGGAKPVPINPYNFRNPDKGMLISSAAGPLSNLCLALICFGGFILISKFNILPKNILGLVYIFFCITMTYNIILAIFNIIPIPPLDGSRILRYFLPWDMKESLDRIEPFGLMIVFVMLFVGGFGFINVILFRFHIILLHISNNNIGLEKFLGVLYGVGI